MQAQSITKDEKTERKFVLQGEISSSGFEIRATYQGKWKLGTIVEIPETSLVVKVSATSTEIYFEIKVNIINPKLELQGEPLIITFWNIVDLNPTIRLAYYCGLKLNRPRCRTSCSKKVNNDLDRGLLSFRQLEMLCHTQENIRSIQLRFMFLNFPAVCLKLIRT